MATNLSDSISYMSVDISNDPPDDVRIHAINVGQGDSILVEFYDKTTDSTTKCFLVDGGRGRKIKEKTQAATMKVEDRNDQHTKNKLGCLEACKYRETLQGIIITHPDQDHYEGIINLLDQCLKPPFILVTEAFAQKRKTKLAKKHKEDKHSTPSIDDLMTKIERKYHSKKIVASNDLSCERLFGKRISVNFHRDCQGVLYTNDEYPDIVDRKQSLSKVDYNETSIITRVDGLNIVLTADSTSVILDTTVTLRGEHITTIVPIHIPIFQVPHHGSRRGEHYHHYVNHIWEHKDFHELYIKYKQLLQDEEEAEKTESRSSDQSEDSMKMKSIERQKVSIKCAAFYHTFTADVYLISVGRQYNHPTAEVLQGIIIANTIRGRKCKIVVTNSYGLDSEKLADLEELLDRKKWWKYVTIYHTDDLVDYEDTPDAPAQYVTLDPHVQKEGTNELHLDENVVEWSPQGYLKLVETRAAQKSEERPAYPFYTCKSVKFEHKDDRIIAMPIPHCPWNGTELNLCYVLVNSISNVASFLEPIDGNPVNTNSIYQLFTYSKDNQWKLESGAHYKYQNTRHHACFIQVSLV